MKQKFSYFLIRIFLWVGSVLPKDMVYRLSQWVVMRYYHLKPKRVQIMHDNIQIAFPNMSRDEVLLFGLDVYHELSKTISEYILCHANRIGVEDMILNMKEAKENLENLKSQSKSGVIIITGHYSNWELFGDFLGYNGFGVTNVVKRSPDSLVDNRIITPFRQRYGNRMIDQKGSMVRLAKALKNNQIVTLLMDQVVQPPNGVVVDFFGHQTAATKSVAMLKNKYNPIVVPMFIERVNREQFMIKVGEPIESKGCNDNDKILEIASMTQDYYDAIEKQIKESPKQWLWLYNRWKPIKSE